MNGLLHRVAARAAGTAVAVRSDAGLPCAGGGLGPGDVGEAEAPFPTAVAPRSQMPSALAAHDRDRATRPVEVTPAMEAARAPSVLGAVQTDAAVRDTPALAPRAESAQSSGFDEPQTTMPPVHAALLMSPATLAAIEPEPAAQRAPSETSITVRTAMRIDDPAPLMPREARPTPPAPVPQPATRRGALLQGLATTQSEADTEVHIHIGRIDVTAVHEAQPPRRRAAAAPAPMSLDGYLAQRGRA